MSKYSILVVDDEPNNFDVVEILLARQDYQLYYAANGQRALDILDLCRPDVILLDVMMPGMDGIEVCQKIRLMPEWESVPIIIVTALTTKTDLSRCLAAGADDFISKPVNQLELLARVRSMLRIRQQYKQLASFNAKLEETVQRRTAQLHTMIFEDALTGLPSRTFLLQQLAQAIQSGHLSFAVIYLDCDQFKLVNGSLGYKVGNQLLQAIGERLRQHLRTGDVLARMGEDEFCYLLYNIKDASALEPWVSNVLGSFEHPFTVDRYEIFMSACIGIALGNANDQRPEEALQNADTAMYKAKLRGKGSMQIFDHQMSMAMLNRLTLETDLQRALAHEEFITYYQPIVDLQTEQILGFESLVRWQRPGCGIVLPKEFISCMEETGLIMPLGLIVLQQACQQLQAWHQNGWSDLTMSVNLAVRQFSSPTLLADIDRILVQTGVSAAHLTLEITESAIMDNLPVAIALMEELRERQIQISIDDFGTGCSSLSYLHRFPVNTLKIDRSFVSQIDKGNRNYQIVNTIIALSNQLELSVVAEGIETPLQLQLLQQLGCTLGQGNLFSEPLPVSEIEKMCSLDQTLKSYSCSGS